MKLIFASLLILALSSTAIAQIKIFVYPLKDSGGFVDSKQLLASTADVMQNLAKRKGVVMVNAEALADVSLEVLSAGKVYTGTIATDGIFGGTVPQDVNLPSITARIHVSGSEYTKDIGWQGQAFWRKVAELVNDQLIAWINTNWAQLKALGK